MPVRMGQGRSRRAVLGGLVGTVAGAALAGCWPNSDKPKPPPAPHPLTPALGGTQALVEKYQATIAGYPDLAERLQPLLADHQAHLDALRKTMGLPAPSAAASGAAPSASVGADQDAAVAALKAAEQSGQTEAVTACLAASAPYAPLLGSIAACRATHVEVLSA
jgi:hypothetical protein